MTENAKNCTLRSLPNMELLNRPFYKGLPHVEGSYI